MQYSNLFFLLQTLCLGEPQVRLSIYDFASKERGGRCQEVNLLAMSTSRAKPLHCFPDSVVLTQARVVLLECSLSLYLDNRAFHNAR
jgi:hypothetical protein